MNRFDSASNTSSKNAYKYGTHPISIIANSNRLNSNDLNLILLMKSYMLQVFNIFRKIKVVL